MAADGRAVADGVWCTPRLALVEDLQREFPMPTFFTGADGCVVADGVWCTPSLALIEDLQRELPTPTFFTGADSCAVADDIKSHIASCRTKCV